VVDFLMKFGESLLINKVFMSKIIIKVLKLDQFNCEMIDVLFVGQFYLEKRWLE
jgi:hypothetical protein